MTPASSQESHWINPHGGPVCKVPAQRPSDCGATQNKDPGETPPDGASGDQTSKWRAAFRVRLEQGKRENSANPNEVWTSADCNIATLIRRSWQMHHGNVAGEQQGNGASRAVSPSFLQIQTILKHRAHSRKQKPAIIHRIPRVSPHLSGCHSPRTLHSPPSSQTCRDPAAFQVNAISPPYRPGP